MFEVTPFENVRLSGYAVKQFGSAILRVCEPCRAATKRSDLRSGRAPRQSSIALRQAGIGAGRPGPGGFARKLAAPPRLTKSLTALGEGDPRPGDL